jgi:hypothetical protein
MQLMLTLIACGRILDCVESRYQPQESKMAKLNQYTVKALNLNDVLVSQKIAAVSADEAAKIVTRKNKYLRVQSVEKIEESNPQHFGG